MRILVVEDEYKLADVVASKLKQNKCVVIVTHSENVCKACDDVYELKPKKEKDE